MSLFYEAWESRYRWLNAADAAAVGIVAATVVHRHSTRPEL